MRTEFKMDFASDNFDNRSIVNLVSSSIVTVGVLKQKDRDLLYQAFPEFKKRMQFMNRVLFQLGKVSLEKHTQQNRLQISKFFCKNLQLNNIMFSTQEKYDAIIDKNLNCHKNHFDLSLFVKQITVHTLYDPVFSLQKSFQNSMLVSDLKDNNFNSQGIQFTTKSRDC